MRAPLRKVGLTGGIGAGKSIVAVRFASLGASVLDADAVSRALLEKEGACYAAVVAAFSPEILLSDGRIDRKKLAGLVFSDPDARSALNAIVHPAVETRMHADAERLLSGGAPFVLFDVPLLFESGMDEGMDAVVLVSAEKETCVQRVMARDAVSREEVLSRMTAQMPLLIKRSLADFILENDGGVPALYASVDALNRRLLQIARGQVPGNGGSPFA